MDPNAPSLPPHPPSGPGKDIDETALDWHATILHLLGFDYEKLTYRFGGRNMRLTDLCGEVVREVLVLVKILGASPEAFGPAQIEVSIREEISIAANRGVSDPK